MYKLTNNETVIRLADNANIPADPGNRDWRKYQAWRAEGNAPQAADPTPKPSVDKRQAAIDALLTEWAARADAPQAVKDYAVEKS